MRLTTEVEIIQDVDIDLDVCEIYNNLTSTEKEDLLDLLLDNRSCANDYFLEGLFLGKSDTYITNNKKVWNQFITFIKYEHPSLKDFIIEELSYEPPKINKN